MPRFNFAWVTDSEIVFGPEHQVEDEIVVSLSVDHSEGDFAALQIVIRNPRIGLLAPARKTWAWISWGSTPLFFGRLIGIPSDINMETCTLQFVARPIDFAEQKDAVAADLRVLPYYDPIFVTAESRSDPDTVLEARPELWHIDRVTHVLSSSHILVGEDGLEEFFEDEVPYDSVQVNIGQVPTRNLVVSGDVSWTQGHSGSIRIGSYVFDTYSGKALIDGWPKPGDNLGGGWTATLAFARDNLGIDSVNTTSYSVDWSNDKQKHTSGDTVSISINSTVANLPEEAEPVEIILTSASKSGGGEASSQSTSLKVPLWKITAYLAASYQSNRSRKESVQFQMSANFQALLTLPGDEEVQTLHVAGGDVSLPSPLSGAEYGETELGIVDAKRRSYFSTDRGLRSLEYLLLRGRAKLMMSARAVQITWACRFERAIELSCRKNALIHDPRLPGGQAQGKIVKYGFTVDGDSGVLIGTVTIGCSIGYGGSVAPVAGEPTYVEEGYVDVGYQFYEGQLVVLDASDVGYTVPIDAPNDDGLTFPLSARQAILTNITHGSADSQRSGLESLAQMPMTGFSGPTGTEEQIEAIINRGTTVPKQVEELLKTNSVWQEIRLRNVNGGPFNNQYVIDVTELELPQGINLEAPSTP